jgi:hypothetical protein
MFLPNEPAFPAQAQFDDALTALEQLRDAETEHESAESEFDTALESLQKAVEDDGQLICREDLEGLGTGDLYRLLVDKGLYPVRRCPACNTKATDDQRFCGECGVPLPKVVQLEEAESVADLL